MLYSFIQDLVTPLTPSAPYTPISGVHQGVASLQPSPHHPPHSPRLGGVPRGTPLSSSPGRRHPEVDLRAELEKHKSSLNFED